jgi:hypothetical protein
MADGYGYHERIAVNSEARRITPLDQIEHEDCDCPECTMTACIGELTQEVRRLRAQRDEANERILKLERELGKVRPIVYGIPKDDPGGVIDNIYDRLTDPTREDDNA